MSKCISGHGEYTSHVMSLDGEHCEWCGELDLAAHDRNVEKQLIESLEVVGDYLVVRGAHEAEYPAGPEYGPYPYSDAEPIAELKDLQGMAAHDRAVKAEAWDEAVEWAAEHARQIKAWRATGGHYTPDHEDEYNPYRDEDTE